MMPYTLKLDPFKLRIFGDFVWSSLFLEAFSFLMMSYRYCWCPKILLGTEDNRIGVIILIHRLIWVKPVLQISVFGRSSELIYILWREAI